MAKLEKVESKAMFDNNHTCCICRDKSKDVQIHHIDGNRSNNDPNNLAVLCLDHHSKASGKRGFGRRYSELEVKEYKKNWEFLVRKERGLVLQPYKKMTRLDTKLMRFEIRKNIYELASTKSEKRAEEILEFLEILYLLEGDTPYALEIFHNVVPFIANDEIGALIPDYITHFFWHLPGPKYVKKVAKKDIKNLNKAIEILSWFGEMAVIFALNKKVVYSTFDAFITLTETTIPYKLPKLTKKIIKGIREIKQKALKNDLRNKKMRFIARKADFFIKKIMKESQKKKKK